MSPFSGISAGGAAPTVLNTRPCCFTSQPGPPHRLDNGPKHHGVTFAARCGEGVVVLVLRKSKQKPHSAGSQNSRKHKSIVLAEGSHQKNVFAFVSYRIKIPEIVAGGGFALQILHSPLFHQSSRRGSSMWVSCCALLLSTQSTRLGVSPLSEHLQNDLNLQKQYCHFSLDSILAAFRSCAARVWEMEPLQVFYQQKVPCSSFLSGLKAPEVPFKVLIYVRDFSRQRKLINLLARR